MLTLGGTISQATAINERGEVVGVARLTQWASSMRSSGPRCHNRPGDAGRHGILASAINEPRGQVVGISNTAAGEGHAFLWQKGVMTDLGTLGGLSALPWQSTIGGRS